MDIRIHHINFKSSKSLDSFIREKSTQLSHIKSDILSAEYHLSVVKDKFKCNLLLEIRGNDIVTHRTTDDMHYSILKAIDAAKKILNKKKVITLQSRQKKDSKI